MSGELHLLLGPMYASKSSTILSKYHIYKLKHDCILINSSFDIRYGKNSITTHNLLKEKAFMLDKLSDIPENIYEKADVILIDEGQFFTDLFEFVVKAVEIDNKVVIAAGLNGDSNKKKIGNIIDLIPYADTITHLTGVCYYCDNMIPAPFTLRLCLNSEQITIGGTESYVPVCRKHYKNLRPGVTRDVIEGLGI